MAVTIRKRKKHDLPGNRGLIAAIDEALSKNGEIWVGWDSLESEEVARIKTALAIHDVLHDALLAGFTLALVPLEGSPDTEAKMVEYPIDGLGLFQPVDILQALMPAEPTTP